MHHPDPWLVLAVAIVALIVAVWLLVEIAALRRDRRSPGAGALREARRDRDRRSW